MKTFNSVLMLAGRIFLSIIFIYAVYQRITHWDYNIQLVENKGLSQSSILLFLACIVELLGSLSLIFGFKTRWGAAGLSVFLLVVTVIAHDFWSYSGKMAAEQTFRFLSNFAIIGGLLYVASVGAGKLSLDGK